MATRALHFCRHAGCTVLTAERFCDKHSVESEALRKEQIRVQDERRGSSRQRGYDTRWSKYSHWYLSAPEHQLCALRLDDSCAMIAQCVDHIDPPDGPKDPRFWDTNNHQPACIHCNSVKGHKKIIGKYRI